MSQAWVVRLGRQAEQDFTEIVQWTARNFGAGQAEIYAETLLLAIRALDDGLENWVLKRAMRLNLVFVLCTLPAMVERVGTLSFSAQAPIIASMCLGCCMTAWK